MPSNNFPNWSIVIRTVDIGPHIESLNVSVATGVILYEAVRQRHLKE